MSDAEAVVGYFNEGGVSLLEAIKSAEVIMPI